MTSLGKFALLLILVNPLGIPNTLLDKLLLCAERVK